MQLNKLIYEKHMEIGRQLKQVRECLIAIALRISHSEGSSSPITKAADRATASVDNLRSRLDNALCASLLPSDESWRGVYYGADRRDS